MAAARSIEDLFWRSEALMEVAQRLPAEEALAVVHNIEEALAAACKIVADSGRDGEVLAEIAKRCSKGQVSDFLLHQWGDMARMLAGRSRADCVSRLATLLPFIDVLGSKMAIRGLSRSISLVRRWWP